MYSRLVMDFRYAFRSLRRARMFSFVATLTLALGIGATASVFSVLDSVVLRPLPYPAPDELVRIVRATAEGETPKVGWPDFADWRAQASGFQGMAAYVESDQAFEWDGGAESVKGSMVTRDLFSVVGVEPVLGRTFTEVEDRVGGAEAVVLSYGLWQSRYGGDPTILGRALPVGGESMPVVGVMPEGFGFPDGERRFWLPLRGDQLLADAGLPTGTRTLHFLDVVGRLAPDADLGLAEGALRSLAHSIDKDVGKSQERWSDVHVTRFRDSMVGDTATTLFFLLAAAGLVLVVACANVAGLVFSRTVTRERELAVRTAIGAGRSRIFRQLLAESFLIAGAAGVAGVGVTALLTAALLGTAPEGMPRLQAVGVTGTTVAIVLALTLLSGLGFGLPPALGASRAGVHVGLAGGRGASAGLRSLRPQQWLVAGQVALAVVLLTAAGLLTNSFARLISVERGFESESVVLATVSPSTSTYSTPSEVDQFYSSLIERVRGLPGVVNATTTWSPPLVGNELQTSVLPEGAIDENEPRLWMGLVIAREGYFETNGVPLIRGRDFDSRDRYGDPMVAIVNEKMAKTLWPGENPLGKRFALNGGVSGSAESFDPIYFPDGQLTVVGVAGDVRRTRLGQEPIGEYYRPHTQITWAFQYLMVRTAGDPTDVVSKIRETVWSVDASVPVDRVEALAARVAESVALPRFRTLLVGAFAGVAGLLAMIGLYAVMSLAVARRTRELGIRLALGASGAGIVRAVLMRSAAVVAVGGAIGLAASVSASRVMRSMLFDVTPTDPLTYAGVGLLVASVALLASYLPARRAGRVDPVTSLRAE